MTLWPWPWPLCTLKIYDLDFVAAGSILVSQAHLDFLEGGGGVVVVQRSRSLTKLSCICLWMWDNQAWHLFSLSQGSEINCFQLKLGIKGQGDLCWSFCRANIKKIQTKLFWIGMSKSYQTWYLKVSLRHDMLDIRSDIWKRKRVQCSWYLKTSF